MTTHDDGRREVDGRPAGTTTHDDGRREVDGRPAGTTTHDDGQRELRRAIGLREAAAIGIGGIIGAGIFVLSGPASGAAGPAVLVAFVLGFFASLVLGFCYAELASLYPRAGGPYAFVRSVFGLAWAAPVGWAYWGAWVAASGYVGRSFGSYLHEVTGIPSIVGASALIVVFAVVNLLGIQFSGKLQFVIMAIEVVTLGSFIVAGAPHVDVDRFTPFMPNGIDGVLAAALIGFISLTGWDAIVVSAEEIRDPRRNVPRAIFISLAVVLLLYLGLLVVANGVMSWRLLGESPVPISDASRRFLGDSGPVLLGVMVMVALTATANAFQLVLSRTGYALARDGLAPRALSRTHARTGTPYVAVAVAAAGQLLVNWLGTIEFATALTGFLYLFTFMMSVVALFATRRRGLRGEFSTPGYPLAPALALVVCGAMWATSERAGLVTGAAWLAISAVVYRVAVRRPQRQTAGAGRGRVGF